MSGCECQYAMQNQTHFAVVGLVREVLQAGLSSTDTRRLRPEAHADALRVRVEPEDRIKKLGAFRHVG